ncbi:YjfB family protein [Paenibacillus sp. CMAA1739]|uniref:Motility protein n=1 Tax=Paenibacillus ottowii TaxID=2315729 RepID=A0ABY3B2B1_9BACL|nr:MULTISPECIES: YjfB family protein [Paenibacillus]MDP1511442.1 YjfB family protein [Paenibacillus ottowii]MEC4568464.1 YjfB family protein [Paenibacillus sp. CMAA1739]NEU28592.1 putative motility protein [Paenibacillus polymyxa]OBA02887.1 putative motility protein [Paenibacillus polymyxa]TQR97851.1 putative motility protein [Paenibacillus ottowii]
MDIAALSTGMSQASLAQAVSVKVMGMAKDQANEQGQALVQMMEKSVQPHLGGQLDIRA